MGMTAPAIYRYFPSLEALIAEVTADLYDELRQKIETARDALAAPTPVARLAEMARAFRRWSVAHPAEFTLMFGSPVPGVEQFEEGCVLPDHAGARFGEPFLAAFGEAWRFHQFPIPPVDLIEAKLGRHIEPYRATHAADDLPIEVIYVYLSAWTRLYGLVAMEVFGHLRWAVEDMEPLFEVELASFITQMQG
jgi:AcrR family transcriptional regulator